MKDTGLRHRLMAILAADVAGYSRLMAIDEHATVAALDAARQVFKQHIEHHLGRVVDTAGDSVLAVFDTAAGAVDACLAIQGHLAVARVDSPEDRRMQFRIGIHLGDVIEKADGSVYGNGVNVAARLQALAAPGGISASEAVRSTLGARTGHSFEDQGQHRVKNIVEPVHAYRLYVARAPDSYAEDLLIKTVPKGGYRLVTATTGVAEDPTATGPVRAPALTDRPSVAVLAFACPRGDLDSQAFASDLARDIGTELARNADLRVASRHSSLAAHSGGESLPKIGRRLRSRYLVDGSVHGEGASMHVDVELTDSQEDRVIWAARHSVQNPAAARVRSELADTIAGTVHALARYAEVSRLLSKPPKQSDVYALTVASLAFYREFRVEAIAPARELLERALRIDPEYAPAWAWLALLTANDAGLRIESHIVRSLVIEAQSQARRALALDSDHPVAWRALAFSYALSGEHEAALAAMQRSAAAAPSSADCLQALATIELSCGDAETALANIERALELYPLPPTWIMHSQGAALWAVGRASESLRPLDLTLALQPEAWVTRSFRMYALSELGRDGEARDEAERLVSQLPGLTTRHLLRRWADTAVSLRERVLRASEAVGMPR